MKKPILRLAPGEHPLERGRYVVPTPPMEILCDKVDEWVALRASGAIVTGMQRFGKTQALRYCSAVLTLKYPSIPRVSLLCKRRQKISERGFFEDFLRAANHSIVERGTIDAKRERLTKRLMQMVAEKREDRLIMVIDDAQHLSDIEYDWLMDIENALDQHAISLTVVLVGQPELAVKREVYDKAGKRQIIGRFMIHVHEFHGIRSSAEMREVLNGYDMGTEYPEGSGTSYTQYFAPTAWERGWRLADIADDLWLAFEKEREKACKSPLKELPMQFFAKTVEYLLVRHGNDKFTGLILQQAVERSGYAEAIRSGEAF